MVRSFLQRQGFQGHSGRGRLYQGVRLQKYERGRRNVGRGREREVSANDVGGVPVVRRGERPVPVWTAKSRDMIERGSRSIKENPCVRGVTYAVGNETAERVPS